MRTDNQGLLTCLIATLTYVDPFPNATLAADWDITNEIVSSLQQLQTSPDLVHVKGHQDDHVPYRSLPLNAQPNVDVDV